MGKWTQEQIQREVELRAEKMEEMVIAQSVKEAIAGLSMMMECCLISGRNVARACFQVDLTAGGCALDKQVEMKWEYEKEIGLALFDAMVKQSLMGAQMQHKLTIPHIKSFMSKS